MRLRAGAMRLHVCLCDLRATASATGKLSVHVCCMIVCDTRIELEEQEVLTSMKTFACD